MSNYDGSCDKMSIELRKYNKSNQQRKTKEDKENKENRQKKIKKNDVLIYPAGYYSTVTDLARLRGQSTLHPRKTAMWYDRSCMGITVRTPCQSQKINIDSSIEVIEQ